MVDCYPTPMMQYTFWSATILLILITDPVGNIPVFANALKHVAPERRAKVQALANALYPDFVNATDAAVGFNDKYEGEWGHGLLNHLEADLSALGEALIRRFDLEDQLIGAMAD